MSAVLGLSAEQILAIPVNDPRKLFTWDADGAAADYKALVRRWHPDRPGGTTDVFAHISVLYKLARQRLDRTLEETSFPTSPGRSLTLRYLKRDGFELGEVYIGRTSVSYALRTEFKDLFDQGVSVIQGLTYADPAMAVQMQPFMPHLVKTLASEDRLLVAIERNPSSVMLRDLRQFMGGTLAPRHVAWIGSNLYNIACYLQYAGLTHNGISEDTVFINPENHTALLAGGWFYARALGDSMTALPDSTMQVVPRHVLENPGKAADHRVDLECIRATLRGLLPADAPRPLVNWLKMASAGYALEEYGSWKKVLRECFGDPKFVELDVLANDIY